VSNRGLAYKSIHQIATTTSPPVSGDFSVYFDGSAGDWLKQDIAAAAAPVALDATDSITFAEHGNRILYCTTAATLTWTLPEPTGTGNWYHFLLGILTTGSKIIKCVDAANTALIGGITTSDGDTLFLPAGFQPGATDDVITLNKTTTGGILGDWVKVTDVATDVWLVEGQLSTAAGSNPATPFSST
jgi:hypothetical protein